MQSMQRKQQPVSHHYVLHWHILLAAAMSRFLAEGSVCGRGLLEIVSRGSAIIAEMLRLAEHIPGALIPGNTDPQQAKYLPVLFDFRCVSQPCSSVEGVQVCVAVYYASAQQTVEHFMSGVGRSPVSVDRCLVLSCSCVFL